MEHFKFVGKIIFEAKTPLHISGIRESNVLYMLRLPDGRLIIPSTSWKGAFRAIAEKLAPSLPMNEVEKLAVECLLNLKELSDYCERFKDVIKGSEGIFSLKGGEKVMETLGKLGYTEDEIKKEKIEDLFKIYLSYHCPIGKLFGNQVWASRVRFFDTILSINTERRAGIGVDRYSGTVRDRTLYFVETIAVGIDVPLIMIGEIYKDTSAKIFASTLEFVKMFGLSIGARKSAGLGNLTIKDAKFYIVDISKDTNGKLLANPFKAEPIDIDSFIAWLRS